MKQTNYASLEGNGGGYEDLCEQTHKLQLIKESQEVTSGKHTGLVIQGNTQKIFTGLVTRSESNWQRKIHPGKGKTKKKVEVGEEHFACC